MASIKDYIKNGKLDIPSSWPVIYNKTSKGQLQQWQIFVKDNAYWTEEGLVGGKITSSVPSICEGKNPGKKNETTGHQQACLEADSKFKKKLDKGYSVDVNSAGDVGYFEPMLAENYKDYKDELIFPVYLNPKLDGIRCIIREDGAWSRNGKKFVSIPHIREILDPLFKYNKDYIFDGEIYADKLNKDFDKIISLARKTEPTEEDLQESRETIEYHIYDFPFWKDSFIKRYNELDKVLKHINSDKIKIVESVLAYNHQDIEIFHKKAMENGYEGSMIRLDMPYENKRTKYLLKKKDWKEEDFIITDIIEGTGNRSGMAGNIILDLGNGKSCSSNIKGGFKFYTKLFKERNNLIGKKVSVQFFDYTEEGSLRFPYVKAIRDYE